MSSFHIIVRALPTDCETTPIQLNGRSVDSLIIPPDLQALPLGVSFEEAAEQLETFSRMFFELDGSFVWRSSNDEEEWQVDGNLYDHNGSLVCVDIKGNCNRATLVKLFDLFRASGRALMIEIVRDAVFVREGDFCTS